MDARDINLAMEKLGEQHLKVRADPPHEALFQCDCQMGIDYRTLQNALAILNRKPEPKPEPATVHLTNFLRELAEEKQTSRLSLGSLQHEIACGRFPNVTRAIRDVAKDLGYTLEDSMT